MKLKHVLVLLLLAVFAGLGAWFLVFRGPPATTTQSEGSGVGGRLAPALAERGGDTARVEIVSDGKTVELARDGDMWLVASKGGYPADADRVWRLVTTISELRTVEAKTALPERHALLSVQWPDENEVGGDEFAQRPMLVRFSDVSGETIAGVVLGARSFTGSATRQYARLLGVDQSWLVSARAEVPVGAMRWLNAGLIELPRESVRRVSISHPEGPAVAVSRGEAGGDFVVEDIPGNMASISEGLSNRVGSALSLVNFTDVKRDEGDAAGASVTTVYETFEGLTITLLIEPAEDGAWVRAKASGEGGGVYNERFAGWVFKVPAALAESLTRRPSDLMTEIAPEGQGPMPGGDEIPELLREPGDG